MQFTKQLGMKKSLLECVTRTKVIWEIKVEPELGYKRIQLSTNCVQQEELEVSKLDRRHDENPEELGFFLKIASDPG